MSHWLLDAIADERTRGLQMAREAYVLRELHRSPASSRDDVLLERLAEGLELAVLDLLHERSPGAPYPRDLRLAASDAFWIHRGLSPRDNPHLEQLRILRSGCMAVLGDRTVDAARWLKRSWPSLDLVSPDWKVRTWATIVDVWLRLIRKDGWSDRDLVLERISSLRDAQASYESTYFESLEGKQAGRASRAAALEFAGLYHLAKAAEVLALYISDGVVDGRFQIHQLLDAHFDRVLRISRDGGLVELEPTAKLLAACAEQLANNSIWTVTRAVNSRVTKFVRTLVDHGRGDRAIFDMLPPQRGTLAERGLLGSSRRAVVVSLPTSSGKTLIAEFRALQALNQFEHERGWVAYLAPTRALVSQVARQFRRDLEMLDPPVVVEQVSPALEVDAVETALLTSEAREVRILVTTPEKLDLMLRQGWEAKIGRPLTLVIVDEAHNIQGGHRGLRLELLLATINSECAHAQFLLLTPFVSNGAEVARWLGGQNSEDISFSVDWQPNERVVGIVHPERGLHTKGNSYEYDLAFESVSTTRQTLVVEKQIPIAKTEEIANTYSKASNEKTVAALTAQVLQTRGPVILVHMRPDYVWSLAQQLALNANRTPSSSKRALVQDFLRFEYGDSYPLIPLLDFGIGVHHSGIPDDVRSLMEWLFESGELRFLVATTTIAQGVNFPVSSVVMASHQYPFGQDMPPEDFWNLAGRAGRVGQGELGIVALAAGSQERVEALRAFIAKQAGALSSALIELTLQAGDEVGDLGAIVYKRPEWSTFVQYLAHTYRQMGMPETFADEVEQVLRNTFGFAKLRAQHTKLANTLLAGIHSYTADYLRNPKQPLALVDSTGFCLQSIATVLGASRALGIDSEAWSDSKLFQSQDANLARMMGVLLRVPELRKELEEVLGGKSKDGDKLARVLKDWVNGMAFADIAAAHFKNENTNELKALTLCGQNLAGRLTQTSAWGLSALLSITGQGLSEAQLSELRNLPSKVLYGVANERAISLRLLGVPRMAAIRLSNEIEAESDLGALRARLRRMKDSDWASVVGVAEGPIYRRVWRITEGLDD